MSHPYRNTLGSLGPWESCLSERPPLTLSENRDSRCVSRQWQRNDTWIDSSKRVRGWGSPALLGSLALHERRASPVNHNTGREQTVFDRSSMVSYLQHLCSLLFIIHQPVYYSYTDKKPTEQTTGIVLNQSVVWWDFCCDGCYSVCFMKHHRLVASSTLKQHRWFIKEECVCRRKLIEKILTGGPTIPGGPGKPISPWRKHRRRVR